MTAVEMMALAIPIAGIAMIVAVVFIAFYFLTKRKIEEERAKAVPYEELKKLVEESNKAQENVIKKLDSVALTLKEIEKLMKEI
jgi:hypothetical protein